MAGGSADAGLVAYLQRDLAPADPEVLAAIDRGPADPAKALAPTALDRLLDPEPLPLETGWCTLPDGIRFVAVRTPMPGVTAEMVDWWFDWHPRDPLRYRVWHPRAHRGNSLEPPPTPGVKPFWGAVHHPVEDIGTGTVHARIEFRPPSELGFSTDVLDEPAVGTVVGGMVGDDRRRTRHSLMVHVFLRDDEGLVLRSHFWLGAAIRPYLPAAFAAPLAGLLNRRSFRAATSPRGIERGLARHCAEEYANLASLLPGLYATYG